MKLPDGVDIITLFHTTVCATCGCRMAAGTQAEWRSSPLPNGVTQDARRRRRGTAHHWPGAPGLSGVCGSEYTIKCVYTTTAKSLRVKAYTAALALAAARTTTGRRTAQCRPTEYIVYQGNVEVARG